MSRIKTEVTYEDLVPYLQYLTFEKLFDEISNLCQVRSTNNLFEHFGNCGNCPFLKENRCILHGSYNPSIELVVKQIQQLHPELFI